MSNKPVNLIKRVIYF